MAVLPKSLIFVLRVPRKLDPEDDDADHPDVFVVNKDSPKPLITALDWAGAGNSYYKKPIQVEMENTPFSDVVIKDLEVRGEGGRAYKVIIMSKYRIDFREDALMDVILNSGIQIGGKLNGEFVFVQFGSQMKLVRVGSDLYKQAAQDTDAKKLSVIPVSQLKSGYAYETAAGKIQIFFGLGHLVTLDRSSKSYHDSRQVVVGVSVKKNMQIWSSETMTRDTFDAEDVKSYLRHLLNPIPQNSGYWRDDFSVKKSHTFVKEHSSYKMIPFSVFTPTAIRESRFDAFLAWKPTPTKINDQYFDHYFSQLFDEIPYGVSEMIEIPQAVLDKIKKLFTNKVFNLDNLNFHMK